MKIGNNDWNHLQRSIKMTCHYTQLLMLKVSCGATCGYLAQKIFYYLKLFQKPWTSFLTKYTRISTLSWRFWLFFPLRHVHVRGQYQHYEGWKRISEIQCNRFVKFKFDNQFTIYTLTISLLNHHLTRIFDELKQFWMIFSQY